jgi:hypothetical protein
MDITNLSMEVLSPSTTVVRICTAFLQQATLPVDGVVNNKIYILFESRGDTGLCGPVVTP